MEQIIWNFLLPKSKTSRGTATIRERQSQSRDMRGFLTSDLSRKVPFSPRCTSPQTSPPSEQSARLYNKTHNTEKRANWKLHGHADQEQAPQQWRLAPALYTERTTATASPSYEMWNSAPSTLQPRTHTLSACWELPSAPQPPNLGFGWVLGKHLNRVFFLNAVRSPSVLNTCNSSSFLQVALVLAWNIRRVCFSSPISFRCSDKPASCQLGHTTMLKGCTSYACHRGFALC